MRLASLGIGWAASLLVGSSAHAFAIVQTQSGTVQEQLEAASRWSSVTGLSDGIQVGLQPGFATLLGASNQGEIDLVNQVVQNAFDNWENPVLTFDVTLDAAGAVEGVGAGFEIDVFAVPGDHPVFGGGTAFGTTNFGAAFFASRPLTNGQDSAGFGIVGADIYINIDNVLAVGAVLPQQQQLDALERLLTHEIGHAIGLGHPNDNNPFGVEPNFDTNANPLDVMAIDPNDPFAALALSSATDNQAIMSNNACNGAVFCDELLFTSLRNDDAGGRDVLYPALVPEPGVAVLLAAAFGLWLRRPR